MNRAVIEKMFVSACSMEEVDGAATEEVGGDEVMYNSIGYDFLNFNDIMPDLPPPPPPPPPPN